MSSIYKPKPAPLGLKLSVALPPSVAIQIASKNEASSSQSRPLEELVNSPIPDLSGYIPYNGILSIEIDEYIFYPLARYNNVRQFIELRSINKIKGNETEFTVYTSQSEGGLFRFCSKTPGENKLDKGSHYIVDTFIDMRLQNYLTKVFNNIPIIPSKPLCETNWNFFSEFSKRVVPIPCLEIMNICNNQGSEHCLTVKSLNNFLGLKTAYDLEIVIERYGLEPYWTEFKEIARKNLDEMVPQEHTFNFLAKLYYLSLSQYLRRYIKILDTEPRFLYSNVNYIKPGNKYFKKIFIKNNFFEVDILIEGVPFTLILSKYYIKFFSRKKSHITMDDINSISHHSDKVHCIITNIIPKSSMITKYGVYSKIVNVGSLIYKPIEYSKQCDVLEVCNEDYTYIGNILENIYPVNVLCDRLEIPRE